jgi:hypothetical protein
MPEYLVTIPMTGKVTKRVTASDKDEALKVAPGIFVSGTETCLDYDAATVEEIE